MKRYACLLRRISNSENMSQHFATRRSRCNRNHPRHRPGRLRARVNVALARYPAALSDFVAAAELRRQEHPPEVYSIPAHFALHNIEQLDHLLAIGSDDVHAFPDVSAQEIHGLRRQLTDIIDRAKTKPPTVSVHGSNGRILGDLPYVRVAEQKLPSYLNPDVDYGQIQEAFLTGGQKIQVIDDFLTPSALDQVQKFCLELHGVAPPIQIRLYGRLSRRRIRQYLAFRHR